MHHRHRLHGKAAIERIPGACLPSQEGSSDGTELAGVFVTIGHRHQYYTWQGLTLCHAGLQAGWRHIATSNGDEAAGLDEERGRLRVGHSFPREASRVHAIFLSPRDLNRSWVHGDFVPSSLLRVHLPNFPLKLAEGPFAKLYPLSQRLEGPGPFSPRVVDSGSRALSCEW